MSPPDPPRQPHPHATSVRAGGALLLTGGMLAVVLTAVGPGFVNGRIAITLCTAGVAIAIGLLCLARPAMIRPWMLPCFALLGTSLIALSSILTGTATDGSEMLYLWVVLYCAYFLSGRYAVLNVGYIAVVYPMIAMSVLGRPGIVPSVYVIGTSVVTVLIVSTLRRQLVRILTATALEARTDGLTNLPNRRSWDEGLARQMARQARDPAPLCALLVDLDHFKALNDTHGHAAGDAALVRVAALLTRHARQSDLLARIGGEEFALLLPGCTTADALGRAEEIRSAIDRGSAGWDTPVTVSVGVAALAASATTGADLMRHADLALYAAKAAGRNTVRLHEAEVRAAA